MAAGSKTKTIEKNAEVPVKKKTKNVAHNLCQGTHGHDVESFRDEGTNCTGVGAVGGQSCPNACIGLGSCAAACKFDAIYMNSLGIVCIDHMKCVGCGLCTKECPKGTLNVVARDIDVYTACINPLRGKAVARICRRGCIGCELCAKACWWGAITMEDNLPVIDYEKCKHCLACTLECPTDSMVSPSDL